MAQLTSLSYLVFPKYFVNSLLSSALSQHLIKDNCIFDTVKELWLITTTAPCMCAYTYHHSLIRLNDDSFPRAVVSINDQPEDQCELAVKHSPLRNLLKCRFLDCMGEDLINLSVDLQNTGSI